MLPVLSHERTPSWPSKPRPQSSRWASGVKAATNASESAELVASTNAWIAWGTGSATAPLCPAIGDASVSVRWRSGVGQVEHVWGVGPERARSLLGIGDDLALGVEDLGQAGRVRRPARLPGPRERRPRVAHPVGEPCRLRRHLTDQHGRLARGEVAEDQ